MTTAKRKASISAGLAAAAAGRKTPEQEPASKPPQANKAKLVMIGGMFPPEVQQEVCYMAAVSAHSKNPDVAKNFIAFLTTPGAKAVIRAKGMQPAGR